MSNASRIEELREEGFTDGMLIAYALLELKGTLTDIFAGDSHSMPPLEAIAVSLGYKPHGGASIAEALHAIADSLVRE